MTQTSGCQNQCSLKQGLGWRGEMPAGCDGTYGAENHPPLRRKESIQASLKGEGTQEVQHSQINCQGLVVESERWLLCVLRLGSVTLSLKASPRVSTNLRPWGRSAKNLHFLSALLKGLLCHVRHCPVIPSCLWGDPAPGKLGRQAAGQPLYQFRMSQLTPWKGTLASITSVGFLWNPLALLQPWCLESPWLGNAFVNDCHSFQPCAALCDAADKVRCKKVHVWHEKSNSCAVCVWQIHGL